VPVSWTSMPSIFLSSSGKGVNTFIVNIDYTTIINICLLYGAGCFV
jgi:hypothetical protein